MAFVRAARRLLVVVGGAALAAVQTGGAARTEVPPADGWAEAEVWFAPNLASPDLVRLFTRPEEWPRARQRVDVFHFYARAVSGGPCAGCGPNTLEALRAANAFRRLEEWGIAVSVEAPAVKEWSCAPGPALAATGRALAGVRAAGGRVRYVAMDEPLLGSEACRLTLEEAAIHAARFADGLARRHPEVAVGDVEPFPHFDAPTLARWLDALLARGFRPAFLHLDVDRVRARQDGVDVAAGLRAVQAACAARRIPFGVIVWGHPVGDARDDRAYLRDARAWAAEARFAAPSADRVIFQSWAQDADGRRRVPRNLPETGPHTHTRLVVETMGPVARREARSQ